MSNDNDFKEKKSNKITNKAKKSYWMLFVMLFAIYLLYVGLKLYVINNEYKNLETYFPIFDPLIGGLAVTMIFSLISRYKSVFNFEMLATSIAKSMSRHQKLVDGYEKTGLSGVYDESIFRELTIIESLNEGDKFKWMDTRIEGIPEIRQAIEKALERGAEVSLLLMDESNPSLPSRYKELATRTKDSYESYLGVFTRQTENFKALCTHSNFRFACFMSLPSFPLILVKSANGHQYAYTGFYMHKRSNNFPYTRWETSDDNFISKLDDFFEEKFLGYDFEEKDKKDKKA